MKDITRELGRTVRAAMQSWPETFRLSVLLAVAIATAWTYYYLSTR